ncbi:hypothetical protein AMELA_G00198730 [Ameiurus melas]|uniref:trypsin n=1 Tax=Ameiurus melas TaxID=219545 RepID=A0A7J6AAA3_AMEME|nr:hypothetical protein AMELA_G00198730 [Ameiurus melas]
MMRNTLVLLLSVLLLQLGRTFSQGGAEEDSADDQSNPSQLTPKPTPTLTPTIRLLSQECVSEKHTRLSCDKVFCLPWQRCIKGQCVCKIPYQCPRIRPAVCGLDKRNYLSLCHAQAIACRDNRPVFSHYTMLGTCEESFEVSLEVLKNEQVVHVKTFGERALICDSESWNMPAANVICRQVKSDARGAQSLGTIKLEDVAEGRVQTSVRKCISVSCTGAEHSLAECVLYKPRLITDSTPVATVICYTGQKDSKECDGFRCVNTKCIKWKYICDGVDHCGDNSDEMCCTDCQNGAFYCKTGVCLPKSAVGDQIRDCLGGEDEVETSTHVNEARPRSDGLAKVSQPEVTPEPEFWSNPKEDILKLRNHTETLQCGIPNMAYIHKTEEETRHRRQKRVVGGEEALPTQIQWQVAVEDEGKIHCGGAYLGGCWVLTAAHCVRQKPKAFRIKFSLWKKLSLLSTTDSVPVKNIIIHRDYNPRTYQNDIALIQLEELANQKECLYPNPAVRSVCVPWSPLQFPPNHTCTISGWGRNKKGDSVNILKWANVSLIPNCRSYYKERFFDGMMCAGDLEGHVDSCQGDSGGPLVCKDANGVSYVWGIVSWGENCGEAGFPGVYTKVAYYFEWIRQHTGWPAVTKYNQ